MGKSSKYEKKMSFIQAAYTILFDKKIALTSKEIYNEILIRGYNIPKVKHPKESINKHLIQNCVDVNNRKDKKSDKKFILVTKNPNKFAINFKNITRDNPNKSNYILDVNTPIDLEKQKFYSNQMEIILKEFHKIQDQLADMYGIPYNHLNLLYNEQYIEFLIANKLGHVYNMKTQGSDSYEIIDGVQYDVEYKTINLKSKKGSKGTFQFHWLNENKMNKFRKCKHVYCCYRYGIEIIEIYQLKIEKIFDDMSKRSKGKSIHKFLTKDELIDKGAVLVYKHTMK